jgi:hypothetical protein
MKDLNLAPRSYILLLVTLNVLTRCFQSHRPHQQPLFLTIFTPFQGWPFFSIYYLIYSFFSFIKICTCLPLKK